MRGKRRSIIFPSLLSLCYVAESSVYELRYRSFSKNPRFALASVCKILTSRSNVRSRTYDIATYGLLWPGERERMRARTLYTTHGNFITERVTRCSSWNKRAKIFSICATFEQFLLLNSNNVATSIHRLTRIIMYDETAKFEFVLNCSFENWTWFDIVDLTIKLE